MIEEQGVVIALEGDMAWVETQRRSACDACSANKGCGVSVLSRALGNKAHRVRALNSVGAQVGQRVTLGLNEDALVKGSFAVYAVPVLSMLAGAILGDSFAPKLGVGTPEGLSIGLGLLGLVGGFGWVRLFSKEAARSAAYQPTILHVEQP